MKALVDHRGRAIRLAGLLGKGGEAEVYDVEGEPHLAAKLYHAPSPAKAAKLAFMVGQSSSEVLRIATWPMATLHERAGGPLVGFSMPKVQGYQELHVLYGVKSRRTAYPKVDWRFLIHVAMNCAAAFETMHRAGVVIGDVNARNVCVSPQDATVKLFDCDSFQLVGGGQQHLCEVGVPEFTPPELQERSFKGVVRTPNHDCFGLAVLVFHLLFMGRHPFFGAFEGKGELSMERAIRELRFAFGRTARAKQMRAPPQTLPLTVLPSAVGELFEAAFSEAKVGGGRPSATEWRQHLQQIGAQLATCAADPIHKFHPSSGGCPWCRSMQSGAPVFFIGDHLPLGFDCAPSDLAAQVREIAQAWQLPAAMSFAALPAASATPLPAEALRQQGRELRGMFGSIVAMVVLSVAGCAALAHGSSAGGVLAGATIFVGAVSGCGQAWGWFFPAFARERRRREEEMRVANEAHAAAEAQITPLASAVQTERDATAARLSRLRDDYERLKPAYDEELAKLAGSARESQRRDFLDQFQLAGAVLPGFGSTLKATLKACGVETALDVLTANLSSIPGVGDKRREALEQWAEAVESRFRFDASKSVPESERRSLASRYRARQQALRGEVELLAGAAKTRAAALTGERNTLSARVHAARSRRQQAAADAALTPRASMQLWWVFALLSALVLVIGFGQPGQGALPSTSAREAVPAPPPAAPPPEGVQVLDAGTGATHWLRVGVATPRKQRLEVLVDVPLLADASGAAARRAALRVLVAARGQSRAVSYQFLVERAHLVRERVGRVDRRGGKRAESVAQALVQSLAGTLLELEVTAQGRVLSAAVLRGPKEDADGARGRAVQRLGFLLASMFVELPDQALGTGAKLELRRSSLGSRPLAYRGTVNVTAAAQDVMELDVDVELAPAPGAARDEALGAIQKARTQLIWKTGDLVPTLTSRIQLEGAGGGLPSVEAMVAMEPQ